MKKEKCLRCGHEWIKRVDHNPRACPRCKNPKWNVLRKENETNKNFRK